MKPKGREFCKNSEKEQGAISGNLNRPEKGLIIWSALEGGFQCD
jgi:hypothetical protein